MTRTEGTHLPTLSPIGTLQIHHNGARLNTSASSNPDTLSRLGSENKEIQGLKNLKL